MIYAKVSEQSRSARSRCLIETQPTAVEMIQFFLSR